MAEVTRTSSTGGTQGLTAVDSSAERATYLPFGQPDFGDDEIAAVTRVLRSGWVGMGPVTLQFEHELAAAVEAPHVVTVDSCTSALFLSLLVHGVGHGDEVVVPSLTWISTVNVVRHLGATPVFCDVDPQTLCVTPAAIAACLTPRTKAVVVVHLGGLAIDIDAIRRVVPAPIAIVEDAAHALGARYPNGRPVGASGHLTCFSFYANKNLSTAEGGAVALGDTACADRLRSLRQHALPHDAWKRYIDPRVLSGQPITEVGYKMNYTDLQAAIGRVQLRRQPELAARRLAIARCYVDTLAAWPWPLTLQPGVAGDDHARHLFLVQLPLEHLTVSRDAIVAELRRRNIGASVHYAPVHRMPLYAGVRAVVPVTDRAAARVLTLPISASMTDADARQVCRALYATLDGATGQVRRAG